nr:helix-turn-helix transcriptional regulator [Cohnella phaseoli]
MRKLNELNQIEFSSRVGIPQATLSELEQDKYFPSVEIIISINTEFQVDLTWLLLGSSNYNNEKVTTSKEKEAEWLVHFNKLRAVDQNEIIDLIKMKLNSD